MAKQKVRLKHNSGVKGSEGLPGQIVEVDDAQAKVWLASGGCVEVAQQTAKQTAKPKRKAADPAAS